MSENKKAHDTNVIGPPFCPYHGGRELNDNLQQTGDRVLKDDTKRPDSRQTKPRPKARDQSTSKISLEDELAIDRMINEGCPNCKDR